MDVIKSEDEKPIKKQKVKIEEVPFRAGIFSTDKVKEFSEIYEYNEPYPHLRIDEFCDNEFLKRVRDEIIRNLKADYKESDIYKVYQSNDLRNFGENDNVPNVLMLRDALFSESFRTFIELITKCPVLSPMVDCSCNLYTQGGHLLCHDDNISTRCISYIIYLTDPDEEWIPEYGGAFEMYAFDEEKREVSGMPCEIYMPKWNSITFFKVEPGVSYHAIQEVFTDKDNRLSISGWYHYLEPLSSSSHHHSQNNQQQLQLKKPINFFTTLNQHAIVYDVPGEFLEDADFKVLAKYINPLYLEKMEVHRIYKKFTEEGSIQLHNFLLKDYFEELLLKSQTSDALDGFDQQNFKGYESGCRAGWKAVGPPQVQRYLTYEKTLADQTDEKDAFGEKLYDLCENFFTTTSLAKLLYFLTGCVPETVSTQIQKFRPGSDYTLAQLESKFEGDTLDVVYTIIDDYTEEKAVQWQSGEIGGFEAYVLPDSENETPADVYGMDEEDGVLSVNPVSNSLNIVLRDEPLLRFFKYVSNAAPGTRCNVSAEFKLSV